jgi:hypothetical protein
MGRQGSTLLWQTYSPTGNEKGGDPGVHSRRSQNPVELQAAAAALWKWGKKNNNISDSAANVYLATEIWGAVDAFMVAMPPHWKLFVDRFLMETIDHQVDEYNGHSKMARNMNCRPGLLALTSLLLAMEANDFVLMTTSNFSRVIDELRRAILDPHCGNCTSVIDLRKAKV